MGETMVPRYCPGCAYALRELPVCPECGTRLPGDAVSIRVRVHGVLTRHVTLVGLSIVGATMLPLSIQRYLLTGRWVPGIRHLLLFVASLVCLYTAGRWAWRWWTRDGVTVLVVTPTGLEVHEDGRRDAKYRWHDPAELTIARQWIGARLRAWVGEHQVDYLVDATSEEVAAFAAAFRRFASAAAADDD